MTKICLNGIVKNESARIERMLASVAPYIDGAAILDTGSTDDTPEKIQKFLTERGIKCLVERGEFRNWGQARNDALSLGRLYARDADYLFLVDADMELVVQNPSWKERLTAHAYDVEQRSGTLNYRNVRLVRREGPARYIGVTHEYLDTGTSPKNLNEIHFIDHADGANRPGKFDRDIALLRGGLEQEPDNERYMYYLAQSLRDSGKHQEAAEWYKRRSELTHGWEEEGWDAQVNYAMQLKKLGDERGFVYEMLRAFDRRQHRAEPLYELAKHYREKPHSQAAANMFAQAGLKIPYPSGDRLFVNRHVYTAGLREEFSITGFYSKDPKERREAFMTTDALSLDMSVSDWSRRQARQNIFHYLPKLAEVCPSFKASKLGFVPPEGYAAMNPSVVTLDGKQYINVRCVNYRMDEQGRYLIRGADGSVTNSNPIRTRNFIGRIQRDGQGFSAVEAKELIEPPAEVFPVEYPLVVGLEDVRLFACERQLCGIANIRQLRKDGMCRQYTFRIVDVGSVHSVALLRCVDPGLPTHEKNWMPIMGRPGDPTFAYMVDRVIGEGGAIKSTGQVGTLDVHRLRGGGQVVPFADGFLAIVHEADARPGNGPRYYWHRWVKFDLNMHPVALSLPFCLVDKQIEFAAGLCWTGEPDELMVSFGFKDCEPWVGTVKAEEVKASLCRSLQ